MIRIRVAGGPGTSGCFDEHSMRPPISYTGLPSSLVSGLDLQQHVSGAALPSGTIELSGFFFGPPQAAMTKVSASKILMRSS